MSTHVKEYCNTPRATFKPIGSLWSCDCGKWWRIERTEGYWAGEVVIGGIKVWREVKRESTPELTQLDNIQHSDEPPASTPVWWRGKWWYKDAGPHDYRSMELFPETGFYWEDMKDSAVPAIRPAKFDE